MWHTSIPQFFKLSSFPWCRKNDWVYQRLRKSTPRHAVLASHQIDVLDRLMFKFVTQKHVLRIFYKQSILNVLWTLKTFLFYFFGYAKVQETLHFIILKTLWERYFWMFREYSETSNNISNMSGEYPTETFQ